MVPELSGRLIPIGTRDIHGMFTRGAVLVDGIRLS